MIVIGELINTSRKYIEPAVTARDKDLIQALAKKQVEAGVDYVEVNAGTLVSGEEDALRWLTLTVQEAVDAPLALDSANPEVLEKALKVHKGKAMVNSISAENSRFEKILDLVQRYECSVVALCLDDNGIPKTKDDRIKISSRLIDGLSGVGISEEDIYIDPLVQPVSTDTAAAMAVLDTIQEIKERFNGVRTVCGLSNVSYGLPYREVLNQAFLIMAMDRGLDAAILNPLDNIIMAYIMGVEALLNRDRFCMKYLAATRGGKLFK